MEKRRRARINQSLNELKQLLLEGNTSKKEVYLIYATEPIFTDIMLSL
jgi:hypothetical protein